MPSSSSSIDYEPSEELLTPIQSTLNNFDIEVAARLERLEEQRKVVRMALSIRFDLELRKYPSEILALNVGDFCHRFRASFQVYHEETTRAAQAEADAQRAHEELSMSVRRSARKRAPLRDVNFTPSQAKAGKGSSSAKGTLVRGAGNNMENPNAAAAAAPSVGLDASLDARLHSALRGTGGRGRVSRVPEQTPLRRSQRTSMRQQQASAMRPSSFMIPETPSARHFGSVMQTPLVARSSSMLLQTPLQTPGLLDPRMLMTPSGQLPRVSVIPNAAFSVANIIAVPLADGSVISLDAAASPSFVRALDDTKRKELVSQLCDIQSQLSSMVAMMANF